MTTKKELNALKKEIKALEKKIGDFLKAVEKGQAKVSKPSKAKAAKAKPANKAVKTSAKKKTTRVSDTDKLLNLIKRSKKGVDVATMKKKTGFNDKKIRNMIYRTTKQGKIKKADRGVYVSVERA